MTFSIVSRSFLVAPLLLISVAGTQYLSDRQMPDFESLPPFVAPTAVVRIVDFGMHSAAASYLWLSAIQNFFPNSRTRFGSIENFIESVNNLDPKFAYPYAFGALVFPELGLVEEGIRIGMRGMEAVGESWEIPYYTGLIYHIHKKDRAMTAKLLDRVGHMSSTPENIRKVALSYGSAGTVRQQSRSIWESIYETTDDEIVMERARRYILHYEILDILDGATATYKKRYGKNPAKIEDLVTAKIIKTIPEDPLGLTFHYDDPGRVVAR